MSFRVTVVVLSPVLPNLVPVLPLPANSISFDLLGFGAVSTSEILAIPALLAERNARMS